MFKILRKLQLIIVLLMMVNCVNAKPVHQYVNGDSIHSLEKVVLGGVKQTILITGSDTINHPILLLLHGGPGFSELRLFRSYNFPLDSSFTVVNWDQRGTGLSYDGNIPKGSISLTQLIEDGHELIGILKKRFGKKKVFLAGHSWGSLLGINIAKRYPEDIEAYIGIGQVVSMKQNEKLALMHVLKMAENERNTTAMKELQPLIGRYPSNDASGLDDLFIQRKWLQYYGGVVYGKRNYNEIINGITAIESKFYNDSLNAEGEMLSMKKLWPSLLNANLFKSITTLKVPVYFIVGRFDYNTSFMLTEKYFKLLSAPRKELIWFEHSAHVMPFEEPERFNLVMKDIKNKVLNKE